MSGIAEKRCDTCRHSAGHNTPDIPGKVICYFDGELLRLRPGWFCCGSWDREPGTDAKEGVMNCKQGDLAVVVRAVNRKNIGKLCRCLKLIHGKLFIDPDGVARPYDTWETDAKFHCWDGSNTRYVQDEKLKPIRDSDGEDEMLRITGKPSKISYKEKAE